MHKKKDLDDIHPYLLDFFCFLSSTTVGRYIFSLPHQWLQFFPERVTLVAGVVGLAVECGIPAEKMPQADPAPYGMARLGGGEAGNPHDQVEDEKKGALVGLGLYRG